MNLIDDFLADVYANSVCLCKLEQFPYLDHIKEVGNQAHNLGHMTHQMDYRCCLIQHSGRCRFSYNPGRMS